MHAFLSLYGAWDAGLMLYEGDCAMFSVVQRQEETQTLFDEVGLY